MSEHRPLEAGVAVAQPLRDRQRARGQGAYLSGFAAEQAVAAAYEARGIDLLETRWRGQAGEVDLVLLDGEEYVFCEVKQAQSFAAAVERLRPAQMRRIHLAASEYIARAPQGQLSAMRFDLAVVDGTGRAEILEGAFSHF